MRVLVSFFLPKTQNDGEKTDLHFFNCSAWWIRLKMRDKRKEIGIGGMRIDINAEWRGKTFQLIEFRTSASSCDPNGSKTENSTAHSKNKRKWNGNDEIKQEEEKTKDQVR